MNAPKISGPAAALYGDPVQMVEEPGFFGAPADPVSMRLQILEARLNEIYDLILSIDRRYAAHLTVNRTHRNPMDLGLGVQDTSRIYDTGIIKR